MMTDSKHGPQKINSSETYVKQNWTGSYNSKSSKCLQHVTKPQKPKDHFMSPKEECGHFTWQGS